MKQGQKLWEVSQQLARVAQGEEPADLVIRHGRLVNVFTGEIEPDIDVAVRCGRIALVGDGSRAVGTDTVLIDAGGLYLAPAFIDGHLHVESSMLSVCEYARAVLPHGTGSVFIDPHEIANVLGLKGIRAMMEDGRASLIRVFTTVPSCVPVFPGLEDSGGLIAPADVEEALSWEEVAGLGEMMNYPGILAGDSDPLEKVALTLKARKTPTGHYASPDTGAGLNAYAASGINCCHEATREAEALARMRLGMYAMIREGSAWRDLAATVKAVTERRIDTRLAVLVSDDLHAETLLTQGHMDHIVRRAISEGVDPVTAIQMATLNPASCFGMSGEIGAIAPGRFADILLLKDLASVKIDKIVMNGKLAAENGRLLGEPGGYAYPASFRQTVRIRRAIVPADFDVKAPKGAQTVNAKIIEVHEANVTTTKTVRRLPVSKGLVMAMPEMDILKVAVIDRHHENGPMSAGFVKGFNLKKGAVASTYAHDAHNLLVLGTNAADMALAANQLIECGGGLVAVEEGMVLALLELPVAGLMSERPAGEVAACLQAMEKAWLDLGSPIVSPFMTMSLLSLPVIPEIRITNRGLVDVSRMKLTTLLEKE